MRHRKENDLATYARATNRVGKVTTHTKFFQGIGALPETLKQFGFNTFLLLYYNQVLGLQASWVSVALFVSLAVDAVTDPIVGSYSDNFRSKDRDRSIKSEKLTTWQASYFDPSSSGASSGDPPPHVAQLLASYRWA